MLNKGLSLAVLLLLKNGLLAVPVTMDADESATVEVKLEEVSYTPQTTYTTSSITAPAYTTILPPYPTTIIAEYPSKPTSGTYSNAYDQKPNSKYAGYKSDKIEAEEDCEGEDDDYGGGSPGGEKYDEEVDDYSDTPEAPYKEKEEKYDNKPKYPERYNDSKGEPDCSTEPYKSSEKVDSYNVKQAPTSPNKNNYVTNNNGEEGHWECRWVKVPKKQSGDRYLKRRFKAPMRRVRRSTPGPYRWPMMAANRMSAASVPKRRRRSVVYSHARR
jgi:hypothetical protein